MSWGSRYIPSALITVLCVVGLFVQSHAFSAGCSVSDLFLYHFSHANIFHFIVNMIGLWQFHPRWKTCAVAFIIASSLARLSWMSVDLPTCGLSAFLFAAYARMYADRNLSLKWVVVIQIVLAFVPNVNWKIHLFSFLVSYATWKTISYIRCSR